MGKIVRNTHISGEAGVIRFAKTMRFAFHTVQILDGFRTTNDNINGLLPKFMEQAGFKNITKTDFINTKIGTCSYYKATK